MANIFLSYASADRDRAQTIAAALEAQGWSVWWDRTIPAGRRFDEVIEEELAAAGCVVVLWSTASVASDWVKTEAAEARDRRVLVPALIDEVKIPLEFRRLQAANLSQWRPGQGDACFDEFVHAVALQLRRGGLPSGAAGSAGPTRGRDPRPGSPVGGETPPPVRIAVRWPRAAAVVGGVAVTVALVVAWAASDVSGRRDTVAGRSSREIPERRVAYETQEREPAVDRGGSRESFQARQRLSEPASNAAAPATRPAAVPESKSPRRSVAARPLPEAPAASRDISGLWQDTTWGHASRIVQLGDSFRFTTQGVGCQGPFRSVGVGTIRGARVESTYESSMPSRGRCWGTVAPDGTTRLTCVDSVCGEFISSSVRQ